MIKMKRNYTSFTDINLEADSKIISQQVLCILIGPAAVIIKKRFLDLKNKLKSAYASILKGRRYSMFASCLEPDVSILLNVSLHDIFLQKVPDFFAEEYFLLNFDWISELIAFMYFFPGLESGPVKHLVICDKGAHHRFEKSSIEHECGFVKEIRHGLKLRDQFIIISVKIYLHEMLIFKTPNKTKCDPMTV